MQSTVKIQYQFRLSEEEYLILAQLVADGLAVQDGNDRAMQTTVYNFLQYAPELESAEDAPEDEPGDEPEAGATTPESPTPKTPRPFSFLKKQAG